MPAFSGLCAGAGIFCYLDIMNMEGECHEN